jgi:hypothetical protein
MQPAGHSSPIPGLGRNLGVPIAAYANRAWLARIPDVGTQLAETTCGLVDGPT